MAYAPGLWAMALGDADADSFSATGLVWLNRSLETGYDPNLTKVMRPYERLTRIEAVELLPGHRADNITNNGDVDTTDIAKFLRLALGAPAAGVYKLGGDLIGSAVPTAAMRLTQGALSTPGPTGLVTFLDFYKTRVPSLRVFMDQGEPQWKYEAQLSGIYNGPATAAMNTIGHSTTGKVLNRGNTKVTIGGTDRKVLSFDLRMYQGADPEFTTVTTSQTNQAIYTQNTGYEEGAAGATVDILMYAKSDDGAAYTAFENNTPQAVIINGTNDTHSLQFSIPVSKYQTANITKNGKGPQLERFTGLMLLNSANYANSLVATLANP